MSETAEALMGVNQGESFGKVPNLGVRKSGSSIGNASRVMGLMLEQTHVSE